MDEKKDTSFLEDIKSLWFYLFIYTFFGFCLGVVCFIFGSITLSSNADKIEDPVVEEEIVEEVKEDSIDELNFDIPEEYYRTDEIFNDNEDIDKDEKIRLYIKSGSMKGLLEFKVISSEYLSVKNTDIGKYYDGFFSYEKKYILSNEVELHFLKDSPDKVIILLDSESKPIILKEGIYEIL